MTISAERFVPVEPPGRFCHIIFFQTIQNMEINVIAAMPYEFCRDFCHLVKSGYTPAIQTAARLLMHFVPEKSILVPIPGHGGNATYTLELAKHICKYLTIAETDAVVFDALKCTPHDSLCELKKSGLPIEDIELGIRLRNGINLLRFIEAGYAIVLIDNVVDTGKTATAAVEAIRKQVGDKAVIHVLAIGDTGEYKKNNKLNYPIRYENHL